MNESRAALDQSAETVFDLRVNGRPVRDRANTTTWGESCFSQAARAKKASRPNT